MTYREALTMIFPKCYVNQIMTFYCPKNIPEHCSPLECENCWEREIEKPPKEEDHDVS